jgi:hypothetical protein
MKQAVAPAGIVMVCDDEKTSNSINRPVETMAAHV